MEVIVEYDYTAEESDELTIKKGDIIKDVSQFEEGWYIGKLNGKIGVFPDNFVKVRSTIQPKISPIIIADPVKDSINDSNNLNLSEYENNNQSPTISTLKPKPVIGIGLGNIFSGQPIQLKQTSLKQVVKENESSSEKLLSSTKDDQVRARYEYIPKQPDELELHVDDLIQVLDRNLPDEGWWKGKNLRTKLVGVFPDNFVIPIENWNKDFEERKVQPLMSNNLSNQTNKNVSVKTITLQNGNMTNLNKSPRINPVGTTTTTTTNSTISSINNDTKSHNLIQNDNPNLNSVIVNNQTPISSNTITTGLTTNSINTSKQMSPSSIGNLHRNNNVTNEKWNLNEKQESMDLPKSHADITNGDLISENSSIQRLIKVTQDRPRHIGRRLPTKFGVTNSLNSDTHSVTNADQNDIDKLNETQQTNRKSVLNENYSSPDHESTKNGHSIKSHDQSTKSYHHHHHQQQQQRSSNISTTNITPNTIGNNQISSDSSRTSSGQESPIHQTEKVKQIVENDLSLHEQNETKQQYFELKKQYESLKESHTQLRADLVKGHKILTERIQSLMDELDEMKKLRASDAIELSRFRSLMMQIDAKYMCNNIIDKNNNDANYKRINNTTKDIMSNNNNNAEDQNGSINNGTNNNNDNNDLSINRKNLHLNNTQPNTNRNIKSFQRNRPYNNLGSTNT